MAEGYYCLKCKVYVGPIMGKFYHSDRGWETGYVCPHCGGLVHLKEIEGEPISP